MRTIPSLTTLIACLALMPACGGGSGNRTAGPMPQGGTFTGVYHSPQYGEMHLVQTGNAIVGEYRRDERSGRIQGTANGNLMRFEWNEERELVGGLPQTTRGRGYFHYSIDEAGKHNILGEWGIDDSDDGGGAWNAYKLNRRSPELSSDRGGGATTGGENDDWDDTGETGGGSGGGDDWDDGGDSGSEDPGTDLDDLDLLDGSWRCVQVNPLTREVLVKIVYYGPGLGGKTTSLSCVHQAAPPETRGQIVSLATPVDRTLYFDFLPVRMAPVSEHHVRLQLFTVPGQVYFNATRKLVLTGADGVIFVADSQRGRQDANIESLENLVANLEEQGRALEDTPFVLQLNKRDLDDILPFDELDRSLNVRGVPSFPTCATTGDGVLTALDTLVRTVLDDLEARGQLGAASVAPAEVVLARAEQPFEERIGRLSEAATEARRAGTDVHGHAEAEVEAELGRASEALWQNAVERARVETRPSSAPGARSSSPAASIARELANLSFASLFPRRTDAALSLEGDLATGALRSAVERADSLADEVLQETARRAGLSEAESRISLVLLLGVDGATWLSFRRLVERVREGGPVADHDALSAYALVIDLRLRADRVL